LAKALSVVALLLAVVALAINFVVPGPAGAVGATGTNGQNGADGADGTNGINCWDLNGNGVPDVPTEDLNGDSAVNVADCTGAQGPTGNTGATGPAGADGINCWDLNGNGVPDLATEDLNGDLAVDVLDCTGPAGPGTIMSTSARFSGMTFTATCAAYTGSEVTITVPGPGTVVVTSYVMIRIGHTAAASEDISMAVINAAPDTCPNNSYTSFENVVANSPTGSYIKNTFIQIPFTVAGAGSYTYYLNARHFFGPGGTTIERATLIAVFYPS